eukprot:UN03306
MKKAGLEKRFNTWHCANEALALFYCCGFEIDGDKISLDKSDIVNANKMITMINQKIEEEQELMNRERQRIIEEK